MTDTIMCLVVSDDLAFIVPSRFQLITLTEPCGVTTYEGRKINVRARKKLLRQYRPVHILNMLNSGEIIAIPVTSD